MFFSFRSLFFLLFFISYSSLASQSLPAFPIFNITIGTKSYVTDNRDSACINLIPLHFSAYYGAHQGGVCYKKSYTLPTYSVPYPFTFHHYSCVRYPGSTLSGSSCIVPDCSGQYVQAGIIDDVILYQCVADPVCSSTEQLINHQCVPDPVCSATEYISNHQCVPDPVCSATEYISNHQCVPDPVCSSTEYISNHQCVPDPVCSATEYISNHQCVPDPVCSATEYISNHQCVPDPVCSSTEYISNHQCVPDPVCSATEYISNHQCVPDPVCSSTEYISNHQCVPDPVCTATSYISNHQCVPDPVCTSTQRLINHQCVNHYIGHALKVDPTENSNPDGSDAVSSFTGNPAPGTPIDPNAPVTVPDTPDVYADTFKYFKFLRLANPFSFDISNYLPTLPTTTCSYEIHRTISVPFMKVQHFDFAPCEPLRPLRDVLQWAFAVIAAWTCFLVIFGGSD